MCSWWILYSFIPILIGITLTQYKSDILKLIRHQIFSDSHVWDVVVYVPSARGHFKEREIIRKTWWYYVRTNKALSLRATMKFVVGNQACPINGEDLKDAFSCEEWKWPDLSYVNNRTRRAVDIELMNDSEVQDSVYSVQSLKFIVHHPVVLMKLGIHDSCRASLTSVRLREATTSKEIVHVSFDAKPELMKSWTLSPKDRDEKFYYKSIHPPYILPKGFRGEIILDNLESGSSKCNFASWNFPWKTSLNSWDVIEFLEVKYILKTESFKLLDYLMQEDKIPSNHQVEEDSWKGRPVHLFNFLFIIHEKDELHLKIKERSARQKELELNTAKESEALKKESSKYSDLLFVDVVDVYRSLPSKLLQFSSWASKNLKFKFVLKTDDDCYLDVEKVLNKLDSLSSSNNTWLGRFRYNWKLDNYGKWAEKAYTSSIYPRFACGSGYVLSEDLVRWLSRNSKELRCYQGEDTSLGIWMSAIDPVVVDEPLWLCEKECLSDMYSMPDLRADEMENYWSRRIKCSDPCGCD